MSRETTTFEKTITISIFLIFIVLMIFFAFFHKPADDSAVYNNYCAGFATYDGRIQCQHCEDKGGVFIGGYSSSCNFPLSTKVNK